MSQLEPTSPSGSAYGSLLARVRALVLDSVVLLAAVVVILFSAAAIDIPGAGRVAVVGLAALFLLYEPLMVAGWGGTLGHRWANLRVVSDHTGGNPGFWRAFGRFMVGFGWLAAIAFIIIAGWRGRLWGARVRVRSSGVALLASLIAAPLVAQDRSPVSVDVTAGPSVGLGGGVARHRAGIAVDGNAAWRVRSVSGGNVLVGLSGSIQGAIGQNDLCEPAAGGGCVPYFPRFYATAILAGMELVMPHRTSVRFLGGPGYYYSADEGDGALGLQGRIELATAPWHHAAFVASLRGAVLPQFRGTLHGLGALGFGIRLQ